MNIPIKSAGYVRIAGQPKPENKWVFITRSNYSINRNKGK